jgi:hypothetical protein
MTFGETVVNVVSSTGTYNVPSGKYALVSAAVEGGNSGSPTTSTVTRAGVIVVSATGDAFSSNANLSNNAQFWASTGQTIVCSAGAGGGAASITVLEFNNP